jgi:putative ABC transport system permease protein
MSRRTGAAGLLGAAMLTAPSASIVVALIAAVVAGGASFASSAESGARDATLSASVAESPPAQRDLSDAIRGIPFPGRAENGDHGLTSAVAADWGATFDQLDAIAATMEPTVARITTAPRAALRLDRAKAHPLDRRVVADSDVLLSFDPYLADLVDVVDGTLPGPIVEGEPIPFVLTEHVAEQFGWSIDEVRAVEYGGGARELRLVGVVAPKDPDAGEWDHAAVALQASVIDNGNLPPTFVGVGFADAASIRTLDDLVGSARFELWFPVDPEHLDADAAAETVASLRRFGATPNTVKVTTLFSVEQASVSPAGRTATLITAAEPTLAALGSLLGIATAAAGFAAAAVLVLAVRGLVARRRGLLTLAAARGASDGARAGFVAVESALLALAGSLVGILVVVPIVGGVTGGALLAGLAATVIAAASAALTGIGLVRDRVRADDPARRRSRVRLAVESGVLVIAAALVLIAATTPPARGGASPVAVLLPVALAAAGCVVALRLVPALLGVAERSARRRRGLVPLLAPARAGRDPSVGAVPVLALVTGAMLAVLGSGVFATVSDGVEAAARSQVGADIRVDARYMGADQVEESIAIDGVAAVAVVSADTDVDVAYPDGDSRVTVYVVEPDAWADVVGSALPVPSGSRPEAIVSRAVADRLAGEVLVIDDTQVTLGLIAPDDSPFGRASSWVAVSADTAEALGVRAVPSALLAALETDADVDAVADDLEEVFAGIGTVHTPQDVVDERLGAPAVRSLVAGMAIAVVAAAVLTVLGALLALSGAAATRRRLFALLRALGSPSRAEYSLVVGELAPSLAVAVPIGVIAGALLVPLTAATIDLTTFTGGSIPPDVVYGWETAGLVLAALVVVVGAAVLVAAGIARRSGAAGAIRTVDEEG